MVPLLYEVLVHAERSSPFGAKGRWYLASAHPDLAGAEASYHALSAQFASPRITLALVRSEHDPASGLFVDRIVKATGRVPMISRKSMERLDPATRVALEKDVVQAPVALPAGGAVPGEPRSLPWAWLGFVAATVGLFAAITAG